MSSSNRELVIDFVSYKLSQKGYSWSQLEEEDENRTDFAAEEAEMDGVLNGSPSWHPPASHVVNGAATHRSSLEVHEIVQTADVRQALREAGDEFELRYRRAFSDLTSQLHITPGTAYQSFEQVVNELFRDGVNWGRIVAFFSFGGALCVESVDKEMRVLVGRVVSWMTTYLTDHLDPWIQENGGWGFTKSRLCCRVTCNGQDAGVLVLLGCGSGERKERFVDLYGNDAAAEVRKGQETFNKWLLTGATVAGVLLLGSLLSRK
ncbi:bcl-2-like protein 1 isoform X1 [Aquila chrysaetos chrysaetos]|uniref:bcl-2-like protein 1 isoform X1 n=1 Tax=Aquila chrysaetos chrysaetos TaxID=223781 RepID=UPI0005D0B924|nr:bcl-2-like protein 1 isoform X1 [Aquila chrysaetos chrysaetos]XP_029864659.1 bcl-2-like protein 1 isoform X1 [Aquila chrysaetos chrysaetos]XP_029864660.1 bcl-2-like protein 1 isoform X1 [Aquila chrysaetos chrysaetos]XP_029864661.1 bcl-2-like protein 1 isoform X1 [Aquila chrysaetos chrysaetos]XP_029864663.1 bcl-2-like protein 1 isoform X1 [Aquila chrysaetos chrysaetos]XP_029864664.1 bcl-2-like protein 1 isoform X1 [Aquila chrysaetos chrysaetos]